MTAIDREPRKKGIPPGTPEQAAIGGEFGHCYNGLGGCEFKRSCVAEGHCIVQYRLDTWNSETDDQSHS